MENYVTHDKKIKNIKQTRDIYIYTGYASITRVILLNFGYLEAFGFFFVKLG